MPRKTKEESEKTYNELLDAAAALFVSQGVSNATLAQIAAEAGKTRGAVYHHFGSKDQIIRALWERNAGALHDELIAQLQNLDEADPGSHFLTVTKVLFNKAVNDRGVCQAIQITFSCIEFTETDDPLQQYLVGNAKDVLRAFEVAFTTLAEHKALRSELAPHVLASTMMGYIGGLFDDYLNPAMPTADLREHGDDMLGLLVNAIVKT